MKAHVCAILVLVFVCHVCASSIEAQQIVFYSNRDGNNEIYVMNSDGSNQIRITNNSSNDTTPTYSPDGSKIAFSSYRDGNWEIYTMDSDGSNQLRLTNETTHDEWPSWSPDGSKILFTSKRDGNYEVYVMNSDGTNQTRLTNNSSAEFWPEWSPDGTKIAFCTNRDGNEEIYVMNSDGSNQINLTNNSSTDVRSKWSPDGSKIVYNSFRDGNYEIYVMNADGSNQTRLTNNSTADECNSWSPDGSQIAFGSLRDGDWEIFSMNADGSNQIQITNNSSIDSWPVWSWAPTVTLTSPNGGESWTANTSKNITWEFNGIDNVKLEYSTNSGGNWIEILASIPASTGSYALTVPNEPSPNCLIRITDTSDDSITDISNTTFTIFSYVPTIVSIPEGSFQMGSTVFANEQPVHTVTLSSFDIGMYEITQGQYEAITGNNPSHYNGDDTMPVEMISWHNAVEFCNLLSTDQDLEPCYNLTTWTCDFSKNGYRLPTEAEWEYACRAETTTHYYNGDNESDLADVGWYNVNSGSTTNPVGQLEANAWGLYDMHGNVGEYCNDWFDSVYYSYSPEMNPVGPKSGTTRTGRGGSWAESATDLRSANRNNPNPSTGYSTWGFRVVRGIPKSLTVSTPNGGESWEASTTQNITWTSENVDNVKLEYSTNNGTDWTDIVASIDATAGSYAWTVPIRPSENCLVRILDVTNLSVTDVSDDPFTIKESTGETIAFFSHRDGNAEIYVMNPDGSNQTRLTNNAAHDYSPYWSPDGSKIAFHSKRDGNEEIYIMDADGSHKTNITNNSADDAVPSWSPDGTKIAFNSDRDGNYEIYVMNADGSDQTRLTDISSHENSPYWSPDGTKIAFFSDRDGNYEIYVMNADGSHQTNITNHPAHEVKSSWSPDGSKIIFTSSRNGVNDIYVMNADGSNQTQLTTNSAVDEIGAWSPDGSQIVFHSYRDGNYEIYSMDEDGLNQTRITYNPGHDYHPAWARPVYVPTPTISLTSPNGGESWEASSTHDITWTSENVDNVKIEYSTDSGTTWTDIVASTAASADSYAWTVPNEPSSNCLVKISDTSNPDINDTSDNTFTISRLQVSLDIKPGSSTNPLNVKSNGVLPAAVLGSQDFDVESIDPSTLTLEGVPPLRWTIEEVEVADGYNDLSLKFDTQELVAALGEVDDGEIVILTLTGILTDGTQIEGNDSILIKKKGSKGKKLGKAAIPDEFSLEQNNPNPFNPTTTISFALPQESRVLLKIYNITGKEVSTLADQSFSAGKHFVEWNARGFSTGIYFYTIHAGDFRETKKMLLMK